MVVAIVLFAFLLNTRTTFISLTAIPVSILVTAIVFQMLGLSINTLTPVIGPLPAAGPEAA